MGTVVGGSVLLRSEWSDLRILRTKEKRSLNWNELVSLVAGCLISFFIMTNRFLTFLFQKGYLIFCWCNLFLLLPVMPLVRSRGCPAYFSCSLFFYHLDASWCKESSLSLPLQLLHCSNFHVKSFMFGYAITLLQNICILLQVKRSNYFGLSYANVSWLLHLQFIIVTGHYLATEKRQKRICQYLIVMLVILSH